MGLLLIFVFRSSFLLRHVDQISVDKHQNFAKKWESFIGRVQVQNSWTCLLWDNQHHSGLELVTFVPGFLRVRENWKKVRVFEWSFRERSEENIFGKVREKSGEMKNRCHQMSDFQANMHQIW